MKQANTDGNVCALCHLRIAHAPTGSHNDSQSTSESPAYSHCIRKPRRPNDETNTPTNVCRCGTRARDTHNCTMLVLSANAKWLHSIWIWLVYLCRAAIFSFSRMHSDPINWYLAVCVVVWIFGWFTFKTYLHIFLPLVWHSALSTSQQKKTSLPTWCTITFK